MKLKTLFSLLWLISFFNLKADDIYHRTMQQNAALYQGRIETPWNVLTWDNLPYLKDSLGFTIGNISYAGRLYYQIPLRLNIYNQELAVQMPVEQWSVVVNPELVDYFDCYGARYVRVGDSYMQIVAQGNVGLLLFDESKIKSGDNVVDRISYGHLKSVCKYYLWDGDALKKIRRSRVKSLSKRLGIQSFDLPVKHYSYLMEDNNEPDTTLILPDPITYFPLLERKTSLAMQSNQDLIDYEHKLNGLHQQVKQYYLQDVTVYGGRSKRVQSSALGVEHFRPQALKNVPLVMGELDVMKLVQTMPGVKSVGEASSGFNVRGGSIDQNLILFNQGTMFNPTHMFGMFGAFNPDLINDANLYKSSIPSQYGGRISSVLEISSRQADMEHWHGSFSLGLLTSRATLDMPLVKNKLSWLLSGRATYSDWLLSALPARSGYKDGNAGFMDLGGVMTYQRKKGTFNLYHYYSRDRFSFNKNSKYAYSNCNIGVAYKGKINSDMNLRVNTGFDHYDYWNDELYPPELSARLSFNMNKYYLKGHLMHQIHPKHMLRYGLDASMLCVMPGRHEAKGEDSWVNTDEIDTEKGVELALYGEDEWTLDDQWTLSGGIRLNSFDRYVNPDFRLSARYLFRPHTSLKLGVNSMHQYIHKVSNTLTMSPTDVWKISDRHIRPQSGWQVAGGFFHEIEDAGLEFSAEAYYKWLDDYLSYKGSARLIMNHELYKDVLPTEGKAYGIELQVKRPIGRFNGWISYEYSRTFLRSRSKEINQGRWFPADYDRPHSFKFVGNLKLTERYSFSSNIDYSSGCPVTLPVGYVYDYDIEQSILIYTDRNTYRLPHYFRMDLSFNIEPNHHLTQKTHSMVSLGVYNVTGRRNIYTVYYKNEDYSLQCYSLSIYAVPVPFISYNIKF